MDKRISNINQKAFAYEVAFTEGKEEGIKGVLVSNGRLELFFNKTNALDISWVKFKGENISFLSKNGLNTDRIEFLKNFEGGFLYTCGLDNVSSCVENKPIHGSLHYQKATNVNIENNGEVIKVSGIVTETSLFGKNLQLFREYEVYENKIVISDTIQNNGSSEVDYVMLYHTNFGYPFLDECLEMNIPARETIPLTEIAKKREKEKFIITSPIDNNQEDVYYHYLKEGNITLRNKKLDITCNMKYSTEDFPVTLEWKSMASGDYALGIEPALTRFDDFKMRQLKVKEKKNYRIEILFG